MANKKNWLGILAITLVFGMTVVGCGSSPSTPKSFVKGSGGETMVLLRQGLDFNQAFREAVFVLSRHGFEPEMMQPEAGYIRTRWNTTWYSEGSNTQRYRVRILINFNPSRTQLIISAPAETLTKEGETWIVGYDTRAIETLRTDLTQSIGN
jgi:hypothetical protein